MRLRAQRCTGPLWAGFFWLDEQGTTGPAPRLAALAQLLRPMQLLPFDRECAAHAAQIRAHLDAAGTPIGAHDLLIAAIALRHQATLVTRNVREFTRVPGLSWVNWHEAR